MGPVEWLRHEEVLAKDPFNYLKVLVWIVGLREGLLPSDLRVVEHSIIWVRTVWTKLIWKDGTAIIEPLLFFFGTFLEEDFAEDVLLLLMRIIILHIIVMRLVKHVVCIVIAIRIFITNPASLAHA